MSEEKRICKVCSKELNENEIHEVWCIKCEVCEVRFQKHDILHLSLGNDLGPNDRINLLCCENCSLIQQVSFYRIQLEKARGRETNLLSQLNMFKCVMMKADTLAAKADDPTTDQPSIHTIRERLAGIETWTIDQMQFWLETYELYAREIASHLGKKATAEELKSHLKEKTKKALEEQAKRQEKEKSLDKKPSVKLSAEDKVIKAYMKIGISEKAAREMYQKQLDSMKGASEK